MNKLVLAGLFVAVALCQAQEPTQASVASSTVDPVDQAVASSAYVLPVLSARAATATLPADLQAQADQVVANAAQQLDACEAAVRANRVIWQYKVCTASVLRTSNLQLNALKAAAAAASPAPEPAPEN